MILRVAWACLNMGFTYSKATDIFATQQLLSKCWPQIPGWVDGAVRRWAAQCGTTSTPSLLCLLQGVGSSYYWKLHTKRMRVSAERQSWSGKHPVLVSLWKTVAVFMAFAALFSSFSLSSPGSAWFRWLDSSAGRERNKAPALVCCCKRSWDLLSLG